MQKIFGVEGLESPKKKQKMLEPGNINLVFDPEIQKDQKKSIDLRSK